MHGIDAGYQCFGRPIDFSQWNEYEDVYISAVTASELLVGVHYARNESQKARRSAFVESVLAKIPMLGFEVEEARVHAGLFAALAKQGKMIGAHDLMIAATAIVHNCAVLTENISEFSRVPGLETITFARPSKRRDSEVKTPGPSAQS